MKKCFRSLAFWCWLCLGLCAFKAAAASGDENWDDRFGLPPGLNGRVNSVLTLGRHVYVGGEFTNAGQTNASGIARWDGKQWSALGGGLQGRVNVLAACGTDLYVGGIFTINGSTDATTIARWTGERWEELGSGIAYFSPYQDDQVVYALAVQGKTLYVGGRFRSAGGVEAINIAKWDGRRWSALGSGIGDPTAASGYVGEVRTLVVHGPYLYAGGLFHSAGGVLTTNLARWDGKHWTGFCPGVSGRLWWTGSDGAEYGGIVWAMAVRGKDLYVGGDFTSVGGVPARNLARWNGSAWAEVGGGVGGPVGSILRQGKDLYVGGYFRSAGDRQAKNLARWNGSRWSTVGQGVSGPVSALALNGKRLYAAGDLGLASGTPAAFIAQWDGRAWAALGQGTGNAPMDRPVALAAQGQDTYVGGYRLFSAGNIELNNLAKWDGTNWSDVGGGIPEGGVSAIAVAGERVYVGGAFVLPEVGATNIACWDGASWSALGGGLRDRGGIAYQQSLAVSEGNLYVAGSFTTAGDVAATNLAVWNGLQWSDVGGGVTWRSSPNLGGPGSVYSMAVDGRDLYVAGSFTHAGPTAATNLAKWDGQTWSAVGGGLPPPEEAQVECVAVADGKVYVATVAYNATAARRLLQWDGANWRELPLGPILGTSPYTSIASIAVSDQYLYVGGYLSPVGGLTADGIVRWDGINWSELGSGVNGSVSALAVEAGRVSMLGLFDTAGGKPSVGFAIWHETVP